MLFDSDIFFQQLVSTEYMWGALISVAVAVLSLILATVIGFFLALGRTSRRKSFQAPASIYVWFFRAIPALLVLLIMWNALPQIIPALRQDWFSPFLAAFV